MKSNMRMYFALNNIRRHIWKILFPILYLFVVLFVWKEGIDYLSLNNNEFFCKLLTVIFHIMMFLVSIVGVKILIILTGTPVRECKRIESALIDVGFVDNKGEPPMLFAISYQGHGVIYEFYSRRLPLEKYKKGIGVLQIAMNIKIIEIDFGQDMRHIIVKGIPANDDLKETIKWKNEYLNDKDFVLELGENYFEKEEIDLNSSIHILIGGGTGSGKSTFLKLILFQCIKKGADVIIGDFKGAVDYKKVWYDKCLIIVDEKEFLDKLENVYYILLERQSLFNKTGVKHITEYNKIADEKIRRIIVVCDEFGQVLNKKEPDKEKLELNKKVEDYLKKLTSLGRAFGIHIILSAQRPDSDVLDGKIKGNMSYKVCGRADSTLSKIIIDNTEAAEMISQKDEGFFITNYRTIFKAYYFEDSQWEEE